MVEHARDRGGGTRVIGMRYDATEFAQGVTEVLAYGTARQARGRGETFAGNKEGPCHGIDAKQGRSPTRTRRGRSTRASSNS